MINVLQDSENDSALLADNLTYLFPMHPFSTPCKDQEILRLSDALRG